MKKSTHTRLGRVLALGLSAAMMSALALVGAAPVAAAPATYSVSGLVVMQDSEGVESSTAGVKVSDMNDTAISTLTLEDGSFALEGLATGEHTLVLTLDGYASEEVDVTVADSDVSIDSVLYMYEEIVTPPVAEPEPYIDTTNVVTKIAGTPVVGNTLTLSTSGWPAGTEISYSWGYSGGQWGDAIEGATTTSLTVTKDLIGYTIVGVATGNLDGFSETFSSVSLSTVVSTPKKKTAAAPVSSSTGLAAYLSSTDAGTQTQSSTGLPSGSLDPGKVYTAQVTWSSQDSYVDVYLYSSPVLVGTFPVVNGVAQVTLSTAVLAQLAAGNHTMVVTGQTSGAVQSVALGIGLPVTGVDVTVPVTVGSLLVLLGAGLMFIRYRFGVRV